MTYDDYESMGYPPRIGRVFYWNYWKRKVHEIHNIALYISYPLRLFCRWGYDVLPRLKRNKLYRTHEIESYSQFGEDLIIAYLWRTFLGSTPDFSWLDIGAHHPGLMSNTLLFSQKGLRGVNIEPDPVLFREFPVERPNDLNLNVGIGASTNDHADFYVMSHRGLNSFSKEAAEAAVREDVLKCEEERSNIRIEEVISVPVRTVSSILESNVVRSPDFVSIDAEGLDEDIVRAWPFDEHRPAIFCIETDKGTGSKIVSFMKSRGYDVFDTTQANTIFVDSRFRKSRWFYLGEYLR